MGPDPDRIARPKLPGHVVVAGSHGLDDTETVHRKLSGGEELVPGPDEVTMA